MVALKGQQATAFLKKPDPATTAILLHGSDPGLVSERAKLLAEAYAKASDPPGDILRIDDPDLETEPDRIGVELTTIPLFGGRNVVRTSTGRRVTATAIRPLVETVELNGVLIVEAGNLKASDAMRALFEKSPKAVAIACYPDEARDLGELIREVVRENKLQISSDATQMLVARLGADRTLSRNEIEKLCLYVHGRGTIEADDIDAVVGDAAELAMERIVNATASGNRASALEEFNRSITAGESAQGVIASLQWHFVRLHHLQSAVEAGSNLENAMRQLRPQVHFKQKAAIEGQCRSWSRQRLDLALEAIHKAAFAARLNSTLEDAIAERLILSLASMARNRPGERARPPLR